MYAPFWFVDMPPHFSSIAPHLTCISDSALRTSRCLSRVRQIAVISPSSFCTGRLTRPTQSSSGDGPPDSGLVLTSCPTKVRLPNGGFGTDVATHHPQYRKDRRRVRPQWRRSETDMPMFACRRWLPPSLPPVVGSADIAQQDRVFTPVTMLSDTADQGADPRAALDAVNRVAPLQRPPLIAPEGTFGAYRFEATHDGQHRDAPTARADLEESRYDSSTGTAPV